MKAPPTDLDVMDIQHSLARYWAIQADALDYVPLGFGDHHWAATSSGVRYFVTVRDLRLDDRTEDPQLALPRLEQTFQAVRWLADVAGLQFVVSPLLSASGSVHVALGSTFALSVFNWLECEPLVDPGDVVAAQLVVELHRTARQHDVHGVREDFRIPHRAALEAALLDIDRPWLVFGPFGEPCRLQLRAHKEEVRAALQAYDQRAAATAGDTSGWCLTHGEPNGSNLLQDRDGRVHLVDWESARVAPPERDLAHLDESAHARYAAHAGSPLPRLEVIGLYRRWYALAETAVYVAQFRTQHGDDANLQESWQNFLSYLPTT